MTCARSRSVTLGPCLPYWTPEFLLCSIHPLKRQLSSGMQHVQIGFFRRKKKLVVALIEQQQFGYGRGGGSGDGGKVLNGSSSQWKLAVLA